jgi:SAM-dependent methyltransferase
MPLRFPPFFLVTKRQMATLDTAGFAELFGTAASDIKDATRSLIHSHDFSYREIVGDERDKLILDILKRIERDQQVIGAEERREVWHKGWEANLQEFLKTDFALEALIPKFIRPGQPVRLNRSFVLPNDPNFELRFVEVVRSWFFEEFFVPFDNLYEFGCGTGFNLVPLAQRFPDKKLFGSDFVQSSVDLVNSIARHYRLNLSATLFDMIAPSPDYRILPSSAIYTFGAIEQLASRFESFLGFLLKQKPGLCLHIEPTVELYDDTHLIDFLGIKFHRKRGYTEGFLPMLQKLAAEERVEIQRVKRLNFGSLFMEGYSLIVWRPL